MSIGYYGYTGASAIYYDIHDTYGNPMHCGKVIQVGTRSYVAVYHYPHTKDGKSDFIVGIATSSDLVNWHQTSVLEFESSQPTLYAMSNGDYMMAWEQSTRGGNHIRVRYFKNLADLLADHSDHWIDIGRPPMPNIGDPNDKRIRATEAIGTPNIYHASATYGNPKQSSNIVIGLHYMDYDTERDRQATMTITNLQSTYFWDRTQTFDRNIENSVKYWTQGTFNDNRAGNIGSRDSLSYSGYRYTLIEGNPSATGRESIDFAKWAVFIYDAQTQNADRITPVTSCGATAFANPHWTSLTLPNGQRGLLVSLFIPSEGRGGSGASATYYDIHDTYGNPMHCSKVIQVGSKSYVAVYHYPKTVNGKPDFICGIATSSDLVNWRQTSVLEAGSSQPTLYAMSNGDYVMAWEQTQSGGNHIRVRYFKNLADLLADRSDHWIDIAPPPMPNIKNGNDKRIRASDSIGTPNIYHASGTYGDPKKSSSIVIGLHYMDYDTKRDRQATLTITNLQSTYFWDRSQTYDRNIENSVKYTLIEGNPSATGRESIDFAYWAVFIYDAQTQNADRITPITKCGATAFANPHWTFLTLPNGQLGLLVSLFIPSEGRGGCKAGTLMYWKPISSSL
eukprot:gene2250-2548_t